MSFFAELERYVRFDPTVDGALLRALAPHAAPHFRAISEDFYARIAEHEEAGRVFTSREQVERLKGTLVEWLALLLGGPWDEVYFEKRVRIGRVHVRIGLPQRYMFAAMDLIRLALHRIVEESALGRRTSDALDKILDLELAIMLESYREAFVERALELRAVRAERLAALGTLAAGLAHEIRNPLNAAHLQLTVMQRRLARADGADIEGARSAAGLIGGELQRLAALVEEFLQFARPQPLRLRRGDLRGTASEVVTLLAPAAAESGTDLQLDAGTAVDCEYDAERIKQVLLNLVRNALEAAGRGGRVRVRVQRGAQPLIEVEDDGPGLPPDAPVFEPFFTTKATGTGLGLSIVHRIVTDHAGAVSVESQPARTVFRVTLPG